MIQVRVSVLAFAALSLGACGQIVLGPPEAVSASADRQAPREPQPDFQSHAGETYAEFSSQEAMRRYSLAGLGVAGAEADRFNHAMTHQVEGVVANGGGVQALVFSGCAPTGCLEGLSVVAVDVTTGEAFVGVSDMGGTAELVPNDRLEALLRLTSPSQSWDDPVRPQAGGATP